MLKFLFCMQHKSLGVNGIRFISTSKSMLLSSCFSFHVPKMFALFWNSCSLHPSEHNTQYWIQNTVFLVTAWGLCIHRMQVVFPKCYHRQSLIMFPMFTPPFLNIYTDLSFSFPFFFFFWWVLWHTYWQMLSW